MLIQKFFCGTATGRVGDFISGFFIGLNDPSSHNPPFPTRKILPIWCDPDDISVSAISSRFFPIFFPLATNYVVKLSSNDPFVLTRERESVHPRIVQNASLQHPPRKKKKKKLQNFATDAIIELRRYRCVKFFFVTCGSVLRIPDVV